LEVGEVVKGNSKELRLWPSLLMGTSLFVIEKITGFKSFKKSDTYADGYFLLTLHVHTNKYILSLFCIPVI